MQFKYETHLHTSEASGCSDSTAAEMVRKHKEEGYTGVFITDHFFNGNSSVPRELPWEKRIDAYCRAYENAKEEGDRIGLDVFFGFEYGGGSDFLIYGLDKAWLKANPDMLDISPIDFFERVHRDGGMVVHAHPFRQEDYIRSMNLYPRYEDAVEVINASNRLPEFDERARLYAEWYGLPMTAGSDSHNTTNRYYGGGIITDFKFETAADYISAIKEGKPIRLLGRFGKEV